MLGTMNNLLLKKPLFVIAVNVLGLLSISPLIFKLKTYSINADVGEARKQWSEN